MRGRNTWLYYNRKAEWDSKAIWKELFLKTRLALRNIYYVGSDESVSKDDATDGVGDDDDPDIVEYPAEGLDNSQPGIQLYRGRRHPLPYR